jgi:hypothetical protein
LPSCPSPGGPIFGGVSRDGFALDRCGPNEAKKGFRKLKAFKQLPALRLALAAHYEKETNNRALVQTAKVA